MYVDDARRGVDFEVEVFVASLCEGEAILQFLDDARFEDRRSDDKEIIDVDEDDADQANAVYGLAKYEHAAVGQRDAECECGEEEGRECVLPDAPGVGSSVRVIGVSQKEVVRVEWCVAKLESKKFGEPTWMGIG